MVDKRVIDEKLNLVSGRMMVLKNNGMKEKYPISLIDINCWEWPQGVGLFGLYKYYEVSGKEEILDFLVNWYDKRIEEGILERNVNTTSPMLTLTYLYEKTGNNKYLAFIEDWADWIMKDKKLIRTGDGCFQHMITGDPNQDEILIDTLFMAVLFLARAGKLLKRRDYMEEAGYQILSHIKYLLNKKEGLFYHGFNFKRRDNYGGILWGRGNCWYTIVIMELIDEIELDGGLKRYFLNVYENQVMALKEYADPDRRLWHTVINNASSYIELSASAAFLYGIMKGVRLGILSREEFGELIERAMESLLDYIEEDGTVSNVSYGTPIGMDEDFYKTIPCCPMTYGQALMILVLQEALLPYWH
ncbi:glycoside hydrolase family 88/105 protein [Lacrimispora brassicae]